MSQVLAPRAGAPSIAEAGLQFVRRMFERMARRRRIRQTYLALSQMDDHQLADIGLNRSMIMNIGEIVERGRG